MLLLLPEVLLALLLAGGNELAQTQEYSGEKPGRADDTLGEFFGKYYPEGTTELPVHAVEDVGLRTHQHRPMMPEEDLVMRSIPVRKQQQPPNPITITPEELNEANTRRPVNKKTGSDMNFEPETKSGQQPQPKLQGTGEDGPFTFSGSTSPTLKPAIGEELKCNSSQINYQGKCMLLLHQGPCATDEWLVDIEGKPTCKKTKCHYPKIPWNGKCRTLLDLRPNEESGCPTGMIVTLSRDGTSECDCSPGSLYYAREDVCYPAFKQGPCPSGKYYILGPKVSPAGVPTKEKIPQCVTNPCGDGKICYGRNCPFVKPSSKDCKDFNAACTTSKNTPGLIRVSDDSNQLKCVDLDDLNAPPKAIGNVPPFPCSPGSRRDATGKCRKTSTFSFT